MQASRACASAPCSPATRSTACAASATAATSPRASPSRSARPSASSPRSPSGSPGTQLTMRTFHIGGAATKICEENRIYLKYPVLVEKVQGSMVTVDNGNMLFTRKGTITVRRILANYELQKGDKVLVKDGQRLLKHGPEPVIQRKGETISSSEICYVKLHAQPPAAHRAAAGHRDQERRGDHLQGRRRGPRRGDHRVLRPVQRAHHRRGDGSPEVPRHRAGHDAEGRGERGHRARSRRRSPSTPWKPSSPGSPSRTRRATSWPPTSSPGAPT